MTWLDVPQSAELPKKPNQRKLEAKANHLLKEVKKTRRGKRRKHKAKIPSMTYSQYMGSGYWRKRKNDYFGAHGKLCAVCGEKSGVTLHHKKYDSKLYGKEPDKHLVALCPKHHGEFHQHHELKGNMAKDTDIYIKHARQVAEYEQTLEIHSHLLSQSEDTVYSDGT